MSHTHKCMRCDEDFYCLTPDTCKAGPDVMPRVVVQGPSGPQIFEHVCQGTPEGRRSPPAGALGGGSPLEAPRKSNLGSAVPSRVSAESALVARLRALAEKPFAVAGSNLLTEAADALEQRHR